MAWKKCLTLSVSVLVDSCKPNVHEAAIPRRQEQAKARECRRDQIAVHLELRHDFWQAVRKGEIIDLDVSQSHESSDRDGRDEEAQRESGDDERLGFRRHVQVPDEVDGHCGDDDVCQNAHDSRCNPTSEDWLKAVRMVVEPWVCSVRTNGHADEGYHAKRRYQCTQSPANSRFVRFLSQTGEEEGDGELAGPSGEKEDEVCCVYGL